MKILLSLAALSAAFVALPAAAQEPVTRTQIVRTADLDLTSPAGVSALDRRIRAAVRIACGEASDVDLHGKNVVRQCRADTLASAERQRDKAVGLAARSAPARLASGQ